MAGSLNKVMLIGNLGKDPETMHFEGGGIKVRFPVATSETYTNRNGEKVTHTEWHNVVVQRKGLAEVCEKYLKKGHRVFLEGRIRSRNWTDDNGQTRYAIEIHADNMTMLTSRDEIPGGPERSQSHSYTPPAAHDENTTPQTLENFNHDMKSDQDDDLPF